MKLPELNEGYFWRIRRDRDDDFVVELRKKFFLFPWVSRMIYREFVIVNHRTTAQKIESSIEYKAGHMALKLEESKAKREGNEFIGDW